MKKLILTLTLAATALCSMGQDYPIVMKINGVPVTRSEFEYNYNKNNSEGVVDKKTVPEYAQLFVNYKLKVQAALDDQLDTLSSFQKEFRLYRDQQIRPLLVPAGAVDAECREYYNNILKSLDGKQLIKPAHIFLRVKQKDDATQLAQQKQRIDSIYQALTAGADFAELAQKLSEDYQTARRGGTLSWIGPNQTLKEFEDVAYSLEVGQTSQPFLSTVGYHIVKLQDKKDLEPFEELKPNIQLFLERQVLEEKLSGNVLESIAKSGEQPKTVEQILDEQTERLCAENNDLKYLVQEYHDGLLLFEECTRRVWEPASKDTVGITNYFKTNKKKYNWDKPHFRGIIYFCQNADDVKAVKAALKGVPEEKWTTTVREQFNKDSITVRMERRLFAQGENPNVDAHILKDKKAEPKTINGYPHMGYIGKVLKKGPEKWTDISQQVVSDYQRMCEEQFVEKLRNLYPFEIYEDVLKTVNNH